MDGLLGTFDIGNRCLFSIQYIDDSLYFPLVFKRRFFSVI